MTQPRVTASRPPQLLRSRSAQALLDAALELARVRELSTPLAATTIDELAHHGGVSSASVRRLLRSKQRLDDHVTLGLVHQHLNWQRAASIWAASQQGQAAADIRGAIEFGFDGSRRLLVDRDAISGFEAVGLSPNQVGWEQRAQVTRMIINPVAVSRTATLQLMGVRPRPPYGVRDLCSDVFACGLGALAIATSADGADTGSLASTARTLERFFIDALEEGPLNDIVAFDEEVELDPPLLSLGERHLVASAISRLATHGLPHPFHHLGVRSVTRAAGTSTGALYGYFDSIDELRAHLVDHAFARRRQTLERPLADRRALLAALADWVGDTVDTSLLFRCVGSAGPVLRASAAAHLHSSIEMIAEVLRGPRWERSDEEAHDRATALVGYAVGMIAIESMLTEPLGRAGPSTALDTPRALLQYLLPDNG